MRNFLMCAVAALSFAVPAVGVTPVTSKQGSNDTNIDRETAIVAVNRGPSGNAYKLMTYMRYTNSVPKIHWRGTYDLSPASPAFDPSSGPGELPIPAAYDRSGDPLCSTNPFVNSTYARTIYCVGTIFNLGVSNANAIGVWRMGPTDPATWSTPAIVASVSNSQSFLDKPSVAVSWHTGTQGWIYVAIAQVSNEADHNQLLFYRSYDGGQTFQKMNLPSGTDPRAQLFGGSGFQSPIVVVDSSNGDIYLTWLSWSTNKIYISRSGNQGAYFQDPVSFDAGTLVTPGPAGSICDTGTTCIGAKSELMARYNAPSYSIGVVWHARETANANNSVDTNVYFSRFNVFGQNWQGIKTITPYTRDQWNPALDYDESGNYLITWYDRRDEMNPGTPKDHYFGLWGVKVNSSGDALESVKHLTPTIAPSTISLYNDTTGRTVGEYQDVWYWSGRWYAGFIAIPNTTLQGDAYMSEIAP